MSEDAGVGARSRRRGRGSRALVVMVGIMAMAAVVLIVFGLLSLFAGGWGVPYFSFATERGSHCTNTLTGYTCDALTADDVSYWADVALPAGTGVTGGSYTLTHDYVLTADLQVPADQADAGLKALQEAYGSCQTNHVSPLDFSGLTKPCVFANDTTTAQSDGSEPDRLYLVGTGVRPDGVRLVSLGVRSR